MNGHISYSQISEYLRCPRYYYYHRIQGLWIPFSQHFLNGKAVHRGAEYNYDQKIETRTDLKLPEVQEVAVTYFEKEAEETEVDWGDTNKATEKDATATLSGTYHTNVAPAIQPVLVESEFRVANQDSGWELLGYHDVISEFGEIRDIKTASRAPSADEADKSLQLTIQALGYAAFMDDESADHIKVGLDYVVRSKTATKAVQLASTRTKEEVLDAVSLIDSIVAAIDAEHFYPNPGSWVCGKKCPFWGRCLGKGKGD